MNLGTIIIYARDMKKSADFYKTHFNFDTSGEISEGLIELNGKSGGAGILIHQAAKSSKLGQVGVKLSFHVKDIEAVVSSSKDKGLEFGPLHQANGYKFANAKDPDGNSISVSSRSFRERPKRDA